VDLSICRRHTDSGTRFRLVKNDDNHKMREKEEHPSGRLETHHFWTPKLSRQTAPRGIDPHYRRAQTRMPLVQWSQTNFVDVNDDSGAIGGFVRISRIDKVRLRPLHKWHSGLGSAVVGVNPAGSRLSREFWCPKMVGLQTTRRMFLLFAHFVIVVVLYKSKTCSRIRMSSAYG
jgi:hypothetical protein